MLAIKPSTRQAKLKAWFVENQIKHQDAAKYLGISRSMFTLLISRDEILEKYFYKLKAGGVPEYLLPKPVKPLKIKKEQTV